MLQESRHDLLCSISFSAESWFGRIDVTGESTRHPFVHYHIVPTADLDLWWQLLSQSRESTRPLFEIHFYAKNGVVFKPCIHPRTSCSNPRTSKSSRTSTWTRCEWLGHGFLFGCNSRTCNFQTQLATWWSRIYKTWFRRLRPLLC